MTDTPTNFIDLDIHDVLEATEIALGERSTNICRQLNSYINRVYDIELESGRSVVIKFYRPGRWSRAALQDEHTWLNQLHAEEVPVIPAIADADGNTLFDYEGIAYSLFEKKGGMILEEPKEDQWRELGHLLSRVHLIGAQHDAEDRIVMLPDDSTQEQVDHILDSGLIPADVEDQYADAVYDTLDLIAPLFDDTPIQRIHGDLHYQNLIYRPNEGLFMIDFDDMAIGPPVQDIWMLLPGRPQDCIRELDLFLEGYQTFTSFDTESIRLIEALRAMRFIHYTSWCVHQAEDGGHKKLGPNWGNSAYWRQEASELVRQQTEIKDAMEEPSLF